MNEAQEVWPKVEEPVLTWPSFGLALIMAALVFLSPAGWGTLRAEPHVPAIDDMQRIADEANARLQAQLQQAYRGVAVRIAALRRTAGFIESYTWYQLDRGSLPEERFAQAHLATGGFAGGAIHPDRAYHCFVAPDYWGGPERRRDCGRSTPWGGVAAVSVPRLAFVAPDGPGAIDTGSVVYRLRNEALARELDGIALTAQGRAFDRAHRRVGRLGSPRYVAWQYQLQNR